MPFDNKKWSTPATQGDVAGIALYASLGLAQVTLALQKLKSGGDISKQIDDLSKMVEELDKTFQEMSGWTAE